ncbi:MAG TPA: asparagine synthase (glutamine-hydrolyzing) [Candidatus Binatia bacterium]|jgi:asparagine synthase (glutamine-hydrolysing)
MCGIAGIINPPGLKADPVVLRLMIERIRHRGPDERAVYVQERAGLAHARLSIIDLASGQQPMHNESGTISIVFNGEIFNFPELRQELIRKGCRFRTQSDTEVILRLYETKGEECVHHLNGQWAFAIWDSSEQKLFLSRDRLGIAPLFYTQAEGAFIFGSEIKAIFADSRVARRVDAAGLNEIFTFWVNLPPRTFFENIRELPPGHSLALKDGEVRITSYWRLNYPPAPQPQQAVDERECAERLLELLVDATRLRLRADVPVGAYLSGGLDSSVIAAIVRRYTDTPLKTFSVSFEEAEFDESRHQREVAGALGTEHREVPCSYGDIGRVFPRVVWHAEKPILRTAPAPLFILSRLVRESGYKVVLTGEGSDEIFGGYDLFKEAKIRSFWSVRPESQMRPLLLKRLYPYLPKLQAQSPAYLQAFFHVSTRDVSSRLFSHLPRWELTSKLKMFLSPEVLHRAADSDLYREVEAQLPPAYDRWDGFSRAQYLEAKYLLPGYLLSSQADRVAMAHSIEARYPFLDHRVVEFANALPPRLKMKVLREKYILKRAATGLVPESIRKRAKQPYRSPDGKSFFAGGAREYAEAALSPERIGRHGIFQPAAVRKLVEKVRGGQAIGIKDNMAFVGVLSTQLVVDQFIDHFGEVQ